MKTSLKFICLSLLSIFIFQNSFAQTLKDAIKMTQEERFESASAAFKKLLATGDDQGGDVYYYYGDNFLQWGILDKWTSMDSALTQFQKGSSVKPSNPLNFVGLGSIAWLGNNAEGAKQNFYKASSLTSTQASVFPKDKQVLVYLKIAQAYLNGSAKSLPDAINNINMAMKLDPKSPDVYIVNGDYEVARNTTDVSKAIQSYEKASDLDKTSAKAVLRQGQIWVNVQNYDEGLKSYKQAITIDSTFAPAYRARAELLGKAGRYKAAIADYRKYLSLNNSRSARERYAIFVFLSKDYKLAIEEIKEVQKSDTSNLILFRLLGYAYSETGDQVLGLSNMERFFAKQKINDKPKLIAQDYSYYGKLLAKSGKDSLGIEQIKKALDLDTSYIDGYSDIGGVYYKSKKFPEAIKYYQMKIAKSKKAGAGDYSALGQAFYLNKDYVKSDSAFAKITETYPIFGNVWRGRCNAKQDDPEKPVGKAKPFYELAIQKAGTDIDKNKKDLIEAYSYLGFYYISQKSYDCSKAAWMKVQELDAANEKATKALDSKEIKGATGTCELFKAQ
jgi:tetratricopeptide (TPR) repeat protein